MGTFACVPTYCIEPPDVPQKGIGSMIKHHEKRWGQLENCTVIQA